MCRTVTSSRALRGERHSAHFTDEPLRRHVYVDDMISHDTAVVERYTTYLTSQRFSGNFHLFVLSDVTEKQPLQRKRFSALVAFVELLLVLAGDSVFLQRSEVLKRLAAEVAEVGFVGSVRSCVVPQMSRVQETLATSFTPVFSTLQVASDVRIIVQLLHALLTQVALYRIVLTVTEYLNCLFQLLFTILAVALEIISLHTLQASTLLKHKVQILLNKTKLKCPKTAFNQSKLVVFNY